MNKLHSISLIGRVGLISLIILTIVSTRIIAQSPTPTPNTGLSISPPTVELSGNPGELLKNTIRLENMNPYPVEIAVDLRNFTAIGEEGAVGITPEETGFSLASWIDVTPTQTTLPAQSTQYFTYSIKIPLNAEPGGHFGSLIFRTIPTEKLAGSGATLAQEIGALVLLRVAGQAIESAQLESFGPDYHLYESGPVNFSARIKNLGNVHTKPTGSITITNLFGNKVASIPVEGKNILPGAVRKFEGVWDTKWEFGYYTATFVAVFPDNTQQAKVASFTVIPYRLVGVVLVVLIFLIIMLVKHRQRLSLAWKILTSGKP